MGINNNDISKSLIIGLKNNELAAFKQLYAHYKIRVFNFSYKHLRSREDAEEVVQDVFIKIWNVRHGINEELSFTAYLYKIAKNQILNKIRKKVGEPAGYSSIHPYLSKDNSTENGIIYNDLQKLVEEAIKKMPPQRKLIYILSRIEGLTYQQIAEKLSISPKTVEIHMSKALKDIKEMLQAHTDILPVILIISIL